MCQLNYESTCIRWKLQKEKGIKQRNTTSCRVHYHMFFIVESALPSAPQVRVHYHRSGAIECITIYLISIIMPTGYVWFKGRGEVLVSVVKVGLEGEPKGALGHSCMTDDWTDDVIIKKNYLTFKYTLHINIEINYDCLIF